MFIEVLHIVKCTNLKIKIENLSKTLEISLWPLSTTLKGTTFLTSITIEWFHLFLKATSLKSYSIYSCVSGIFFFWLAITSIKLTHVVCVAVAKQHSIAWISKTYFCVLLMAIIRFFSLELLWIKLLKLLWSFVYLSSDGHLYTSAVYLRVKLLSYIVGVQ